MQSNPDTHNPFACPHCGAMQPRFVSRAGLPAKCAECGAKFVVGVPSHLPPAHREAGSEAADEADAYELEPPLVRGPTPMFSDDELKPAARPAPGPRTEVSLEPVGYDSDAAREARLFRFRHAPDAPPKVVFLSGVFDFPWQPGVWPRWIAMSAALIIDAMFVIPTLSLLGLLSDGGAKREMIQGLLLGLPALLVTLIAAGYITACLLAVIEDTASGCDRIQEWPESDWREWIFTIRIPLLAGFGSLLAGSALELLAGEWNLAADLAAMIVFPILLLSMLETGSAWVPISGAILKTCTRWWWAWLLFYAETGAILLVWSWVLRFTVAHCPSIALWIVAPITIAGLLISAHLLGRLAWYTSWEEEEPDAEEASTADTEESAPS